MELHKLLYIGRHGLRSPITIPPPYEKDWPGKGLLTAQGAKAQYFKGAHLRDSHPEFFQSSPSIKVSTSNLCRTISSAYSFLNGIRGSNFIEPDLRYRSQMVTELRKYGAILKPLSKDVVYRSHYVEVSPKVAEIYRQLLETSFMRKKHYAELSWIIQKTEGVWEYDKSKPVDYFAAFYLYDFLCCYDSHGRKLPPEFSQDTYHQLGFIHYFFLHDLMFSSTKLRRLTNHFLCQKLLQDLTGEGIKEKSFSYYSGHDTNVFALLHGLGYKITKIPDFSAGILLKVYKSHENQYVDLQYEGKNINREVFPEKPPGKIPLHELVNRLQAEAFASDKEYMEESGNRGSDCAKEDVAEDCSDALEEGSLKRLKVK